LPPESKGDFYMPKSKFKINPHSLEYERVSLSWKERLRKAAYYGVALSVLLFVAYVGTISGLTEGMKVTPEEVPSPVNVKK